MTPDRGPASTAAPQPVPAGPGAASTAARSLMVRALKWSFLSELAAKAIQPIIFVLLARFISPDDFGVVSAALMATAFSQILWDAGLGKALVQHRGEIGLAASVVLWINLALGVVVAAGVALLAGPIATGIFRDARVAPVLTALSLQVLLGAAGSVHTALLQRELAFKKLFWVRLSTAALPGLASIPLAWAGLGYWALVAGTLVGQAAQMVVLWSLSTWRPVARFDRALARQLVRFGAWVELAGLLSWFFAWGDALVVGMYLGSHELGLYRVGAQFASTVFAVLLGPVSPVLYSFLCRMNADPIALRKAAERIVATLTLVTIPTGVAVAALASPISTALFGARWTGVDPVISAMALMHGFSWMVGMNGEIYRASGKPSYEPIVTAAMLPVYLAAYLLSARWGLGIFLWTRFLVSLAALVAHLAVLRWLVGIAMLPPLVRAASMALAVGVPSYGVATAARHWLPNHPWSALLASGALVAAVASAVLFLAGGGRLLRELVELRRDRAEPA